MLPVKGADFRMAGRRTLAAMAQPHRTYWQRNLRLIAVLLAVWFLVTFVIGYFARDLDFSFFGWPFSFWVAAQGGPLVYVVITWVYAHRMDKLDKEHGVAE